MLLRLQRDEGDRSPLRADSDERPQMSSDAAAVFLLALFLSALIGALVVLPYVEEGIGRNSRLTSAERRHAAGVRLGLDARQFDAFRLRLKPGQRYSMDVAEGPTGPYFSVGKIVRDYAAFYFLPAIKVKSGSPVFRYQFR